MYVLWAGEENDTSRFLADLLNQLGHELESVRDGIACIFRLSERVPDVLVMEENILWGGGDGVLARIGEIESLSRLPVVLIEYSTPDHERRVSLQRRFSNTPFEPTEQYVSPKKYLSSVAKWIGKGAATLRHSGTTVTIQTLPISGSVVRTEYH